MTAPFCYFFGNWSNDMKKKRMDNTFSIILFIIFILIGLLVRNTHEGLMIDLNILDFLHMDISPLLFNIMDFVSFIGSPTFLVPLVTIIILYLLYKKRFYISKLLLASSLGSWIFNFILKFIFNRSRPLDYFLVDQGGLSYPSGHSMVSMSMYLTIGFLLIKYRNIKPKMTYTIATLLVFIMGISRLYLGVHWPTDIIGGFIMGYLFFRLSIKYIKE